MPLPPEQAAAAAAEQEVRLEEATALLAQAHAELLQREDALAAARAGSASEVSASCPHRFAAVLPEHMAGMFPGLKGELCCQGTWRAEALRRAQSSGQD